MTEYYTSCEDSEEIIETVRELLKEDGHSEIRIVRGDIRVRDYNRATKRIEPIDGVPCPVGKVFLNSIK